jgi:hypothetical protein
MSNKKLIRLDKLKKIESSALAAYGSLCFKEKVWLCLVYIVPFILLLKIVFAYNGFIFFHISSVGLNVIALLVVSIISLVIIEILIANPCKNKYYRFTSIKNSLTILMPYKDILSMNENGFNSELDLYLNNNSINDKIEVDQSLKVHFSEIRTRLLFCVLYSRGLMEEIIEIPLNNREMEKLQNIHSLLNFPKICIVMIGIIIYIPYYFVE